MDKVYGLLGETLKHSLSPELHAMLGDNGYRLFEIAPDKLAAFMRERSFDGINVTIPYKRSVMPMLSRTSETARRVGRVNTVIKQNDGRLFGYNTDVYGFSYLLDSFGINVSGKSCLILGNGGGAAAVKTVLDDRGAGNSVMLTRAGKNRLNNTVKYTHTEIIINATPVGMYPENGKSPVSLDGFDRLEAVIDIVYNPQKTALMLDAQARGIPAYNGLTMLAAQAKRARELFDGHDIDDSVIPELVASLERKMTNIVLIGMPGCGKTAVGAALAERLGKKQLDIDGIIEMLYGRSPEKIIRRDGEAAFRRVEHIAAEWAGKHTGVVISAGGGIVTYADNYGSLKQNGTVVFIERSLDALPDDGRPLSQSSSAEELYRERLPLYRKWCDFEVSNNGSIEETVNAVISGLKL